MDIEAMKNFNEEQMLEFLAENSDSIKPLDLFLAEVNGEEITEDDRQAEYENHESVFYELIDDFDKRDILSPTIYREYGLENDGYEQANDADVEEFVSDINLDLNRFEPWVIENEDNTVETLPFMYDREQEKFITASEFDKIMENELPYEAMAYSYERETETLFDCEYPEHISESFFDKTQEIIESTIERRELENEMQEKSGEQVGIEQ